MKGYLVEVHVAKRHRILPSTRAAYEYADFDAAVRAATRVPLGSVLSDGEPIRSVLVRNEEGHIVWGKRI